MCPRNFLSGVTNLSNFPRKTVCPTHRYSFKHRCKNNHAYMHNPLHIYKTYLPVCISVQTTKKKEAVDRPHDNTTQRHTDLGVQRQSNIKECPTVNFI